MTRWWLLWWTKLRPESTTNGLRGFQSGQLFSCCFPRPFAWPALRFVTCSL
jgi:hypothetical protein